MKKILAVVLVLLIVCTSAGCGSAQSGEEPDETKSIRQTEVSEPEAPAEESASPENTAPVDEPVSDSFSDLSNGMSGDPSSYDAEVPAINILRNEVLAQFTQELFEDNETGLSIDFNLFLPENYGNGEVYPLVVFISDSSLVGKSVDAPVAQCRGAMVWATSAWQAEHPCIVAVPQFNATVIDDNDGTETVTDYVEATANLIRMLCENYDVDTNRVYGMGQSMGCMITMYLTATYDDLYTACLFVDGQWNIEQLEGLKDHKFFYFAAEGDKKASTGMEEVKEMLSDAGISYSEVVWNAKDEQADLNAQAVELLAENMDINFVSWMIGSVVGKPGQDGGMREHMASFDYAFRQTVIREWLFAQSK